MKGLYLPAGCEPFALTWHKSGTSWRRADRAPREGSTSTRKMLCAMWSQGLVEVAAGFEPAK
jgi:hypothetical protein